MILLGYFELRVMVVMSQGFEMRRVMLIEQMASRRRFAGEIYPARKRQIGGSVQVREVLGQVFSVALDLCTYSRLVLPQI